MDKWIWDTQETELVDVGEGDKGKGKRYKGWFPDFSIVATLVGKGAISEAGKTGTRLGERE